MPKQRPAKPQDQPGQVSIQQRRIETISGPIPSSTEIERYESVLPGSADRILSLAERQQDQRHRQEDGQLEINQRTSDANIQVALANVRMQDASIKEVRRGQFMAFIMALFYLGATVYVASIGAEIVASAMGVGGLAALAAVFIKVRRKQ